MSSASTQWLLSQTSTDAGAWDLPRDPTAPRLARRALVVALADLPRDLVQVAQVLASELVTNALKHGCGRIALSVVRDDRTLMVRVADEGSQAPVVRQHDVTSLNGRGLQLIEGLAAAWGTEQVAGENGGKTVWFTLRTTPSQQR